MEAVAEWEEQEQPEVEIEVALGDVDDIADGRNIIYEEPVNMERLEYLRREVPGDAGVKGIRSRRADCTLWSPGTHLRYGGLRGMLLQAGMTNPRIPP